MLLKYLWRVSKIICREKSVKFIKDFIWKMKTHRMDRNNPSTFGTPCLWHEEAATQQWDPPETPMGKSPPPGEGRSRVAAIAPLEHVRGPPETAGLPLGNTRLPSCLLQTNLAPVLSQGCAGVFTPLQNVLHPAPAQDRESQAEENHPRWRSLVTLPPRGLSSNLQVSNSFPFC